MANTKKTSKKVVKKKTTKKKVVKKETKKLVEKKEVKQKTKKKKQNPLKNKTNLIIIGIIIGKRMKHKQSIKGFSMINLILWYAVTLMSAFV